MHCKKAIILRFLGMLAILLLVSCENPANNREYGYGEPLTTRIKINNSNNPFGVSVYSWYERISANRIAFVEGSHLEKIDVFPTNRASFFPTYHFNVEGFSFRYDLSARDSFHVNIPNGLTTTIHIRSLSDFVSRDTPLVNRVYLHIENNGHSLFWLTRGSMVLADRDGRMDVNPGEAALFGVYPGDYRIMVGANNFSFPANLNLRAGNLYFLEFDGITVSHEKTVPITLRNATWDDNGSIGAPFRIYDEETLRRIGRGIGDWQGDWSLNAHYRLVANINLTLDWIPIGTSGAPFTGSLNGRDFDGSNKTITGLTGGQGLFAEIGTGGIARNLTLENVNIASTNTNVGAVAGVNRGEVLNSFVSGSITSTGITNAGGNISVGGIVGWNLGEVSSIRVSADVGGSVVGMGVGDLRFAVNVGGVTGRNDGFVRGSSASGEVSGVGVGGIFDGATHVAEVRSGGVVGFNVGMVENSLATGNVRGDVNGRGDNLVGGIAGWNGGEARNNLAAGHVAGHVVGIGGSIAGGIAGANGNHGALENNMALNRSVSSSSGNNDVTGRIVGIRGNILRGRNRAWRDMPVNGGSVTDGSDAYSIHGWNVSEAEVLSHNTWIDMGFVFGGRPWRWVEGEMPHLFEGEPTKRPWLD